MQVIEYDKQYPNGLILDVIFRFKDFDWLVRDANNATYILRHQSGKRSIPFHRVHWSSNNCSIGIWHNRKFYSKKILDSITYEINEDIKIYEPIRTGPSWLYD